MLRVVRARVSAEVPPVSDSDVQELGGRLYTSAEDASTELGLPDKGVEINVREGSLEIVVIVLTTVGTLYTVVTMYDGFWSGIERISNHAKSVGRVLGRRAATEAEALGGTVLSTKVTLGHLEKLHRVYRALEAGEIDAETAAAEVVRTLRASGDPVTAQVIAQVEQAVGATSKGLIRLSETAEKEVVGRDSDRVSVSVPRPRRERRRRLTIRRLPGERMATMKFDR